MNDPRPLCAALAAASFIGFVIGTVVGFLAGCYGSYLKCLACAGP